MSRVYFKATRADGTDFHTGTIRYGVGETVIHPTSRRRTRNDPSTYLSVSTVPTDCSGMEWPCRLFEVQGVGRAMTSDDFPNKRAFLAVRVVRELPAWQALGPNGREVVALIEQAGRLAANEPMALSAIWDAPSRNDAWYAAWAAASSAARYAALAASRNAAWSVARNAARTAALALVTKDLITSDQFDILYGPWAAVIEDTNA